MTAKKQKNTEIRTDWTLASVREEWIKYFKEQSHMILPSASLVPAGDPTLLFTTAGMVQFKPFFAGTEEPPSSRVVTIQKCLRTTDLESVGKTERHCTFFEMLGNFSFGDYFKEGAIKFAWEFSINHLKLDPEKIYITVYEKDTDAEKIWLDQIQIPSKRITHLGKEHNWWGPAGDSGACGPCSELYLDRGEERCTCKDKKLCAPGAECDRFMEYWNIVFNEFNQDLDGNMHPLPLKGIDTGAGLERIAALLNQKDSVYDTDEMSRIISEIEKLIPELREDKKIIRYTAENAPPFRVLTDHARAACFAIADGIHPDNTGRGYVIRRIIRRALLFARELGIYQPILFRLAPLVVEIYEKWYPELRKKKNDIVSIISSEEERFLHTLDQGLKIWDGYLLDAEKRKDTIFRGEDAFKLYDTYGFPLEMTMELALKEGLTVDTDTFELLMQKQRENASRAASQREVHLPPGMHLDADAQTEFTGYETLKDKGEVLALVCEGKSVKEIKAPCEALIITDKTPFYAEGGGQLGDRGRIFSGDFSFSVRDTQKKGGLIIHSGEIISGSAQVGQKISMEVDEERRRSLIRHHSATHLLNASLRKILGDHVMQTGSLVSPDYLRFDFSHSSKIDASEILKIEKDVISSIRENGEVIAEVLPIEDARKTGAVAAFGEKYGEEVRVLKMGPSGNLSIEFCGGCHVSNTGDISLFHIIKEGSPGAGNRRIEAIAGDSVILYFQKEFEILGSKINFFNEKVKKSKKDNLILSVKLPDHAGIENMLRMNPDSAVSLSELLVEFAEKLSAQEKAFAKEQKAAEAGAARELTESMEELLASAVEIHGISVISALFDSVDGSALRQLGDAIKEKKRNAAVFFGSATEKGPVLVFMANKDAVSAGVDCGKLIREASSVIGGKGGGRPDMAQAGGKDPENLKKALDLAVEMVKKLKGV